MKLWILSLLVIALGAIPTEPEKILEALRSEFRAEVKKQRDMHKDDDLAHFLRLSRAEALLTQILAGDPLKDDRLQQTIPVIEGIHSLAISEKVDVLCRALLPILKERQARRTTALREKTDKLLRAALEIGFNAKTAKELDAPLAEIGKLRKEVPVSGNQNESRIASELQSAERILTAIQDGLLPASQSPGSRSSYSAQQFRSEIKMFSEKLGGVMPRSEFLEKMDAVLARRAANAPAAAESPHRRMTPYEAEKMVQALVAGVKKLDDVGGVLDKLDELTTHEHKEVGSFYGGTSFSIQLSAYRRIYEALRKRAATSVRFTSSKVTSTSRQIEPLEGVKDVLLKFAVARVLSAPEILVPKSDESTAEYLQRAFDSARSTSNWALLEQVFDVVQTTQLSKLATPNDTRALHEFLGGMNEERAEEFSAAVSAYLAALKTGSQAIPVAQIQLRLAALKKDHPEDYAEGTQAFNSPTHAKAGNKHGKDKKHPKKYSPPPKSKPSNGKPSDFTLLIPALPDDTAPTARQR